MTAVASRRYVRIVQAQITPRVRAALTELHHQCYRKSELGSGLFDSGTWFVGYHKGQTIAFAGIVQSRQWSNAGYLCRVGVAPEFRGFGLQKRLIETREDFARAMGWEWVITDTRRNPASANSLISMGFRMYEPTSPWSFKDALYWMKRVSQ